MLQPFHIAGHLLAIGSIAMSVPATIELADQLFKKPSWLTSAADEDDAWEKTLLKLMEYLNAVKKPMQVWRQVLHNHFVRRKVAGGPIIPSIRDCHTVAPAIGGGFEATLNIQNSLSVGDGLELSVSAIGDSDKDAVNNVCHKTFGLLLLTDASQVLLQPAQWSVPGDDIVSVAALLKRMYVERWGTPSATGDVRMGDERPRVQPPPSRARAGLNYEPPQGPEGQEQRDKMIADLLNMEIRKYGTAWPFLLHHGRWHLLDQLLPPGALKSWVQAHPDEFMIIHDSRQRWGIIHVPY